MDAPSTPPAPTPASAPPAPVHTTRQKVFIYGTLIVTVGLALSLILNIGLQWINQRTPTSYIVFHGDASLAGGSITITSDAVGASPRMVQIPEAADLELPVFLESGRYDILVRFANGYPLLRDPMYVAEGSRYDINLTRRPATRP